MTQEGVGFPDIFHFNSDVALWLHRVRCAPAAQFLSHSNSVSSLLVNLLQGLGPEMAATHPLPPPASEVPQRGAGSSAATAEPGARPGLIPVPVGEKEEQGLLVSPAVARLPVEVDVAVPVRNFRVRHLLALEPEQVIESQWSSGDDAPLAAGDVHLAWAEFEVLDTQMAVRVTRLA